MSAIKNKRGFTLIEVIVTLVIVALLAAITVPSFAGYIDRTRAHNCEAQRGKLTEMYLEYCDWEGYDPAVVQYSDFVAANGLKGMLECPSGGIYSYDAETEKIVCTKHPDAA